MPGALLDDNATVLCAHGASAKALTPNPRVKAAGAPTLTIASQFQVSGCPNVAPGGSPLPCQTASFIAGATRVTSGQQPVLLADGKALAVPTGTPLSIVVTQIRVKGQ